MNTSLVNREVAAEDVRKEFEGKGFSHAVIDFLLIRNDNFHYQVLSERMNSFEKQMDGLEKNMNIKFDAVNQRMDNLEKSIDIKFDAVNQRMDNLEKSIDIKFESMRSENNRTNRLITILLPLSGVLLPIVVQKMMIYFGW